eukprot:TRINITY_DN37619_c0_g1_i1.p1 TRINITY_DN37619_c0_g1~~TRINITY_DN37619_c0_g1_i1.p1  ORF type:complete len:215 (+),score=40.11 TRINITY_DN37619_c0_g1_i1:139-783(+)
MNNARARKVLQVSLSASFEEIKTMHKKLVVKHHPDKGGDVERMKEVNEAFAILKTQQGGVVTDVTRSAQPGAAAGMKRTPEIRKQRPLHKHTVFNHTAVKIKKSPLHGNTSAGKLRDISSLLKSAGDSDQLGPKLQSTNSAHWGKSYGPHGRGTNNIDINATRQHTSEENWNSDAGENDEPDDSIPARTRTRTTRVSPPEQLLFKKEPFFRAHR